VMSHLGMLLKENSEAAVHILSKECLFRIGTCVALRGRVNRKQVAMAVRLKRTDGTTIEENVSFGELKTLALGQGETASLQIIPRARFDVGKGKGKKLEAKVSGGELGLILDARGRPLGVPAEKNVLVKWRETLRHGQQSSGN